MNSRRSLNSSRLRCSETSGKLKIMKKPEWDNTISDLNCYKPSPEDLERRRMKMQTKNKPTGKVNVHSRLYRNMPNLNGCENSKEKLFLQNMFCDETNFWEAIAKSDKALSVVQDLFGDTAKKHRGLPRVTQAPLSANSDSFAASNTRSQQNGNQVNGQEKDSLKSHANSRSTDGKFAKVSLTLPSEEPELKTNLDHVSAAVTRAAALNDSSSSSEDNDSLASQSSNSDNSQEDRRRYYRHKNRRRSRDNSSKHNRKKKKDSQPKVKDSPANDELRRFKEFLANEKIQDKVEQENQSGSTSRLQLDRINNRSLNRNNNFRRTPPDQNADSEATHSPIVNKAPSATINQTQTPLDAAHQGLVEGHRLRSERRFSSSSIGSSKDAWCVTAQEASLPSPPKVDSVAPVRHLIEQLEREALKHRPLNPEDNNNERIRQAVSQLRIHSLPNDETDQMTKLTHRMIASLKRLLSEKDNAIQDLDNQIKKMRELVDVLTMELITTNEKADNLMQSFNDYKADTDLQISRLKSLLYSQMGIREAENYSKLTSQCISNSSSQASNRPYDQLENTVFPVNENKLENEVTQSGASTPKVPEVLDNSSKEDADIEHTLAQNRFKAFMKLPVPAIRTNAD